MTGNNIGFKILCPENLGPGNDDHTRPLLNPVPSFFLGVILSTLKGYTSNVTQHSMFDFDKPFFDHTTSICGVNYLVEWDFFFFGRYHSKNFQIWIEIEFGNTFETFFQMRLDTSWILCLGKNFQKFVIGQEEKSRKVKTFFFQIGIETFLSSENVFSVR